MMPIRIVFIIFSSIIFFSCQNTVEVIEETYEDETPRLVRSYKETSGDKENRILLNEKVYYPNGNLQIEGSFKENKRNGLWTYYYLNGNKWSEAEYKDGQYHGKSNTWYENGKLRYEGFYKNDMKTGKWKFYSETGELEKEVSF